jgi:hypothetical protein
MRAEEMLRALVGLYILIIREITLGVVVGEIFGGLRED